MHEIVLISACLVGIPCRYNGEIALNLLSEAILHDSRFLFIPVCPEQLAGLSTPREPVEIQQGDGRDVLQGQASVKTRDSLDFTKQFIQGAQCVLQIARITKAKKMITQHCSPSCASSRIYNGDFSHRLREGPGVCAALLQQNGILTIDVDLKGFQNAIARRK